jgi:hypothetical protein
MSEILGTSGHDTITEDSGFPGGVPGAGSDTITGLDGDDVIAGGDGDDRLIGDGGAETPVITAETNPFPADLDVGDGSAPSFTDVNGDGVLDLVVGAADGNIYVWQRDGDRYAPLSGSDNPFGSINVGGRASPTFTDLDGDGDLDLVVGASDGSLRAWRRDDNEFIAMDDDGANLPNPFTSINVGTQSTPTFTDLNGDGHADLVVGSEAGALRAWQRDAGTGISFTELTGSNNPFASLSITPRTSPTFMDLDGDGDTDLLLGTNAYGLRAWQRNADGSFTPLSIPGLPERPPLNVYAAPSFADLDGDGGLEIVVGQDYGTLLTFALDFIANHGNDSLVGGAGDDTLAGGAGDDTLDGGAGGDWASYAGTGAVTVDLGAGSSSGDQGMTS